MFPEDYKIKESNLIQCLVAEGFIVEKSRMRKYEVARSYLHELTNKSLILTSEGPLDEIVYRMYHIHDILREILLSKSNRQNFATIVAGEHRIRWPQKVRRLAFHDYKSDTNVRSTCFKYLRSLIFIKSKEPLSKSKLSRMLCGGSRILKVLVLEGTGLDAIPEEVFKLLHLRTLNLKRTRLKIIPRSIGCLKNLEFLDLAYTNVSELPEDILKIKGLIHLNVFQRNLSTKFHVKGFKGPSKISKLASLEWLFCVEANETLIKEIGMLKKLQVLALRIQRREDEKHLWSSLRNLNNLRGLFLQAESEDQVIGLDIDNNISLGSSLKNLQNLSLRGCLERVPKFVSCLLGLISVSLVSSGLMDSDPLESLQYLPNLKQLLLGRAFEGESLCFRYGCFLKLESLSLIRLRNLKSLRVEKGAMPNLELLGIISLQSLQEFPRGIQHLPKLQHLYLELMSDKVIVELQNQDEESENYHKLSHILQILIWDHEDGWCRHPQYWKTRKFGERFTGQPAHDDKGINHQQPLGYFSVIAPSEVEQVWS